MAEISRVFRNLASVLEAFENVEGDAELTTVAPRKDDVSQDETISVNAQMRFPFLNEDVMDYPTQVVAKTIGLTDDGSLEVDFQLTATPNNGECRSQASQEPRPVVPAETTEEATEQRQDEHADSEPSSGTASESATNEVSKPAYRDPDQLEEVYETHETFQEMTDALAVDVTPQTVRRYMIKHGIHTPSSTTGRRAATMLLETDVEDVFDGEGPNTRVRSETAASHDDDTQAQSGATETTVEATPDETPNKTKSHSESSADHAPEDDAVAASSSEQQPADAEGDCEAATESTRQQESAIPQHASDGGQQVNGTASNDQHHLEPDEPDVDLPDHLTLEQIKTTVRNAKTLYDVQQELDIDRERAQSLLQDLNLLDLVHGRLSTRGLQERTMEEINRRIQTHSSGSTTQPSTTHG